MSENSTTQKYVIQGPTINVIFDEKIENQSLTIVVIDLLELPLQKNVDFAYFENNVAYA